MDNSNRRESVRKTVKVVIRLTGDSGDGIMHFVSGDVSAGGVFIESDILFEIGDIVHMEFCLPGDKSVIAVRGRVVRTNKERVEQGEQLAPGMGVSFLNLKKESETSIRKYLSREH